jgi:hypothetical protein
MIDFHYLKITADRVMLQLVHFPPGFLEIQKHRLVNKTQMRGVLESADRGVVGSHKGDQATRLENTVELIHELKERIVIAIAMRNVLNVMGTKCFTDGLIFEGPGELEEIVDNIGLGTLFGNINTRKTLLFIMAAGQIEFKLFH